MTLQSVAKPDPEVWLSRKVQNATSQCSAASGLYTDCSHLYSGWTQYCITKVLTGKQKNSHFCVCDSTLTQPLPTP